MNLKETVMPDGEKEKGEAALGKPLIEDTLGLGAGIPRTLVESMRVPADQVAPHSQGRNSARERPLLCFLEQDAPDAAIAMALVHDEPADLGKCFRFEAMGDEHMRPTEHLFALIDRGDDPADLLGHHALDSFEDLFGGRWIAQLRGQTGDLTRIVQARGAQRDPRIFDRLIPSRGSSIRRIEYRRGSFRLRR